jgi:hypothetical protein
MSRNLKRKISRGFIPLGVCAVAQAAWAVDIEGVLPAALDQPQTHMIVRQNLADIPIIGQDILGDPSYDIQAYLDTGTSTILLSNEVWDSFGLNADSFDGAEIQYNDIGIGGSTAYNVSTPYYFSLAPFSSANDVEFGGTAPDISDYTTNFGPLRTELNPVAADDPSDQINIAGMPVMQGKVAVLDLRPVNNLDEEHTYLYAPGTPLNPSTLDTDPGIPQTQYHVKLSYASFDQFTTTTPVGAPGPLTGANPFIGPNPLRQLEASPPPDNTPPISISFNGHASTGSFLFDTGADVSFLSTAEAAKMHVEYATDAKGNQLLNSSGDPYLISTDDGTTVPNQFNVPVQGTGGEIDGAGFYLDSLTIPTIEGEPLNFVDAPVVVLDITVQDATTGKTLTLDGDLGMNFLVASLDLNSFDINAGAFDWATFDQPNGLLGLTLTGDEPVEIATGSTLSASSDGAIGDAGLTLAFTGGTLAVTAGFSSSRPMEVGSAGGTIDTASGATLALSPSSLTWMGGTLNVTDRGTVSLSLSGASVYVIPGSAMNISAGASVVVGGSTDPFTDSLTSTNHVAIVNDGSLTVNVNSAIAGITGAGRLTVGTGSSNNTLKLAAGSGGSSVSSLIINTGSTLDLTNNHLIINYAGGADPVATIRQYLQSGYNKGLWNGTGISSSSAAASGNRYALGYADGADGIVRGLSSGQIEVKYTIYGDLNLDGVVTGSDFTILAENLGKSVTGWDKGDFTYAGVVTATDFTLLAENLGKSASGAAVALPADDWAAVDAFAEANGLMADVPEPGGGILCAIGAGLVMRRTRRLITPD